MTRVFTAMLGTETNTFSWLPTGEKLFEETGVFRNANYGDKIPGFASPLVVWQRMAQARKWEIVESLCTFATPAGKTVKAVYEGFRDEILADLKAAMPVEAVLLNLHGAMVAEGYDDAEGDLLKRVRKLVGAKVPIGVELDLHGNVGDQKLDNVDIMVLYKEYPHIDMAERAAEVFNLIADKLEGKTKPVMAWFDCRTVGLFHTTRQPMRGFVDKCSALEGKDGILSVSVIHGFPWADVAEMGSKLLVIADGDKQKAQFLAEKLGREFFEMREETQPNYTSLDDAIVRLSKHKQAKPIVIADVSDNAGGGATSDSTFILEAMLNKGIKSAAIGMFWDPMAVRVALEVGEGAEVDIRIGGKFGPASGNPLDLRAKVTAVRRDVYYTMGNIVQTQTALGDMAVFEVDGISIVCNTIRKQCRSLQCFTNVGIDPSKVKVVVVKSMQHFYDNFAPIAADILYVPTPGAVAPNLTEMTFLKASKHQWPFIQDPFASEPALPVSQAAIERLPSYK